MSLRRLIQPATLLLAAGGPLGEVRVLFIIKQIPILVWNESYPNRRISDESTFVVALRFPVGIDAAYSRKLS